MACLKTSQTYRKIGNGKRAMLVSGVGGRGKAKREENRKIKT
jgi:hypothetical protein